MGVEPYKTELQSGLWTIGLHEHHKAGPNSGHPTIAKATYGVGGSSLAQYGNDMIHAYSTHGGANPESTPQRRSVGRSSTPATVIAHGATGRPDDSFPHASIRMWTPEGHELSTQHVQGIMSGHHDPEELRKQYQDWHELNQQHTFERKIREHIAKYGGLPHSGTTGDVSIPTATSPVGAKIMSLTKIDQNGQRWLPSSPEMPHYSRGVEHENPQAGVNRRADEELKLKAIQDRSNNQNRVVDHR